MTILASDIITRVRVQLIDEGSVVRWTDDELLDWITDAQRAITVLSPSAASTTATVPLVTGTKQSLPADGYMMLNAVRNVDSTGTIGGRAIRLATRDSLDANNPNWHTDPASGVAYNYVYDPSEQLTFYVYPPNNGSGYLQVVYAQLPVQLTADTDELIIQDAFQPALFDYVMMRAWQKDTDFAAGMQRAQAHMQAFAMLMQQADPTQLQNSPDDQLLPFNPQVKGAAK